MRTHGSYSERSDEQGSWRSHGSYKTEGIILKRINYGEADKILTIYTKHHGKIKALAKGIRKLTSRKAGSLELFNHAVVFLVKGKNFDLVTEAQAVDLFKSWRQNLIRVGVAYYFCELVDKLTPEEQENMAVFELLSDSLGKIDKTGLKVLVRDFEEKLLTDLGFGVPAVLQKQSGSLKAYIESIIEKRINSPKIIKRIYG
ncbi:DNA repair protein RecO [Patescibacteria group bacterium]|nr:DNA repair protein RecO [Patescibacteria group bacterium]